MSEALWIELIKVLPAFLWIGFGFIALAIARRLLTAQAPRMSKIETPWVTVELAQQAMEQAAMRGPAAPPPVGPFAEPPPWGPADPGGYGLMPEQVAYDDGEPVTVPRQPVGATPPASARDERPAPTSPPPAPQTGEGAETESPQDAEPSVPPAWPGVTVPPYTRPRGYDATPDPPWYPPYYPRQRPYELDRPVPPLPESRANDPYGSQSGAIGAYPPPPSTTDSLRGLRAATRLAYSAERLQGGSILWVDDHHEWNEPLIRLFRSAGIAVDVAASTQEAMLVLEGREFDLVITDMRRERDGDDAGVQLLDRMAAAGITVPAVVFADHPDARAGVHPRAIAATNSPETLVETVVDVLGARRRTEAAGPSWLHRLRGE